MSDSDFNKDDFADLGFLCSLFVFVTGALAVLAAVALWIVGLF